MNKKTMNLLAKAESMLGAYSSLIERSSAIDADSHRERGSIDRASDHLFVLRCNGPATDLKSELSRKRLASAADYLSDYAWRLNQMAMWAAEADAPGCAKMRDTFKRMSDAADSVRALLIEATDDK